MNKNTRFPEYLSLYVDSKLRKGKTQLPDEEYDAIFDKVLTLFRCPQVLHANISVCSCACIKCAEALNTSRQSVVKTPMTTM